MSPELYEELFSVPPQIQVAIDMLEQLVALGPIVGAIHDNIRRDVERISRDNPDNPHLPFFKESLAATERYMEEIARIISTADKVRLWH